MRRFLTNSLLLLGCVCWSQANTEVHVFDLFKSDQGYTVSNGQNISQNEGYDNQPSFYDDQKVLFASTRNGQTDILLYNLENDAKSWLSDTPGGEYSPTRIPNSEDVSAIRLDPDGKQLLYRYDFKTGTSKPLIKDLVVGYHTWFNENMVVSSVLDEGSLSLMVSRLNETRSYKFQKQIGRSLHKIPNSELVSYISKEKEYWEIKSVDPISGATKLITYALPEKEDLCWLADGTILMATNNYLMKFNPTTDQNWSILKTFTDDNIVNISRLAVNPSNTKLALVAETSPAEAVQAHIAPFNERRLDDFANCFSEDVLVANFPSDTMSTGRSALREGYRKFYENVKQASVRVAKRIVINNKVIDEEFGEVDGSKDHKATFYEVKNGLIGSMIFLFDNGNTEDVEAVVEKQLDAYRARDIDGFLATYSDDIELFNFPAQLNLQGKDKLRASYRNFFANTPDLNCEIKTRMIIGNNIIDEEWLTINGEHVKAVAVYEVNNGLITKVTFVQ